MLTGNEIEQFKREWPAAHTAYLKMGEEAKAIYMSKEDSTVFLELTDFKVFGWGPWKEEWIQLFEEDEEGNESPRPVCCLNSVMGVFCSH